MQCVLLEVTKMDQLFLVYIYDIAVNILSGIK